MSWLRRLFGRVPSREHYRDEVMSELIWRADGSEWVALVAEGRRDFEIAISADKEPTPHPELLAWARAIDREPLAFAQEIRDFVRTTIAPWGDRGASLADMEIEFVGLYRPNGEGMVFFKGADDAPVWRCDLIAKRPANLGCDS